MSIKTKALNDLLEMLEDEIGEEEVAYGLYRRGYTSDELLEIGIRPDLVVEFEPVTLEDAIKDLDELIADARHYIREDAGLTFLVQLVWQIRFYMSLKELIKSKFTDKTNFSFNDFSVALNEIYNLSDNAEKLSEDKAYKSFERLAERLFGER